MLSPFFTTNRDLFDDSTFFNRGRRGNQDLAGYEFNPTVDVRETPEAITLHCEVAGVPMENLSLDFKDDRLTISGRKDERKEDKDKGANYSMFPIVTLFPLSSFADW